MQILHYRSCSIFHGIARRLKEISIYDIYTTGSKNSSHDTNSDFYILIMDLHY